MDKSGSAFPYNFDDEGWKGMTLREYFAAHAPAVPAVWFTPTLPPQPKLPSWPDIDDLRVREDVRIAFARDSDPETKEGTAWFESYFAAGQRLAAWQDECQVLRFSQWPWAWADRVLSAKEAQHG